MKKQTNKQENLKITATGKIQHFIFFVPSTKKDRIGLELKDQKKKKGFKSRKRAEKQA